MSEERPNIAAVVFSAWLYCIHVWMAPRAGVRDCAGLGYRRQERAVLGPLDDFKLAYPRESQPRDAN